MAKIGVRTSDLLALSAVVLGLIWPIGCEAALPVGFGSPALRLGFFVTGSLTAILFTLWWVRKFHRGRIAERHYLTSLCEMDPHEIWHDEGGTLLPPPSIGGPWSQVLEQVHQAFRDHGRQIQNLEQARSALEIRCRRATSEAAQIKGILSSLPEPILVADSYDELVMVNSSAEQLFQFDMQNVETRAAKSIIHCQKLVDLLLGTARHKSTERRNEDIEIADMEGHSHWYRATAARLSGENKATDERAESCGAVVVLRNIGEHKAVQKRNAEFVSSVSHEMKTPLAGIKAYVELLADGDAEDENTREEFLAVINGQADRLQRLVENLLNLARIEAGVVNVSKEPRSLNEILDEALSIVQPSAEAKSIALINDLSPMYLSVLIDRDMLLQAAINLLSNAIKYTPPGGSVTLRSRMEEGQVRFDVQDTGVGLSGDDCNRVFEKFYRVERNKEMAPGTGLGLPLAKHIVEDVHGGRLTVESTLGQGSTFSVELKI